MERLEEKLEKYARDGRYPFHMPGHKRQEVSGFPSILNSAARMDITEISDFDDLHAPEEVIYELEREMSQHYNTKETLMLVNGATSGILAAISACTNIGDEILIARNVHKSVINACLLRNLKPHYLTPENTTKCGILGGIDPQNVDKCLKNHPNVRCVVIVSPTYEGIISDIEGIFSVTKGKKIPLIVDEAHGAHFNYIEEYKKYSAVSVADIVIQSMHKTLPALTMSALLHVSGELVDISQIKKYYSIYQTSSPSYLIMSSMSACFHYLKENRCFDDYLSRVRAFRNRLSELKHIHLLSVEDAKSLGGKYDEGKLVFVCDGMNAKDLANILRQRYNIELEMSSPGYCIAMTSVMDTDEGFECLLNALTEIDEGECFNICDNKLERSVLPKTNAAISPYEASISDKITVSLNEAIGCVSAQSLYIYPPGAAFIVAGEIITKEIVDLVEWYLSEGFEVHGLMDGKAQIVKT